MYRLVSAILIVSLMSFLSFPTHAWAETESIAHNQKLKNAVLLTSFIKTPKQAVGALRFLGKKKEANELLKFAIAKKILNRTLPHISIVGDRLYVKGDKAPFVILGTHPFMLSHRGQVWTFNSKRTASENIESFAQTFYGTHEQVEHSAFLDWLIPNAYAASTRKDELFNQLEKQIAADVVGVGVFTMLAVAPVTLVGMVACVIALAAGIVSGVAVYKGASFLQKYLDHRKLVKCWYDTDNTSPQTLELKYHGAFIELHRWLNKENKVQKIEVRLRVAGKNIRYTFFVHEGHVVKVMQDGKTVKGWRRFQAKAFKKLVGTVMADGCPRMTSRMTNYTLKQMGTQLPSSLGKVPAK